MPAVPIKEDVYTSRYTAHYSFLRSRVANVAEIFYFKLYLCNPVNLTPLVIGECDTN